MTQTVLILGANGRFGRNAQRAFHSAGWRVRTFERGRDTLTKAVQGVDVIVNAWNPPYPDWARLVPGLHGDVIAAARSVDATVIIPGNVYVFGAGTQAPWSDTASHAARNPLGRIRIAMEEQYRASGVRTIILRAGDFIDIARSGNWFDRIMIKSLEQGVFTYPGDPNIPHAWAFLPDVCRATVQLAEKRAELPVFSDICFAGYTLAGEEVAAIINDLTPQPVRLKRMAWWPLRLAAPVWRLGACLVEMRYLWDTPHWLDGGAFDRLLPGFQPTTPRAALAQALQGAGVATRSTQTSR